MGGTRPHRNRSRICVWAYRSESDIRCNIRMEGNREGKNMREGFDFCDMGDRNMK